MPVDAQLATEQCAWTKERQREYMKGYREANKEKIREHKAALYALQKVEKNIGDKRGPKPKILTAVEAAQKLAEKKAAKAEYDKAYRKANSEKLKLAKQAWGKTAVKKEYDRKWASENKARVLAIKTAYRARPGSLAKYYRWRNADMALRPDKYRLQSLVRQHRLTKATPSWADRKAMKKIYESAMVLGMDVDHIIPINGKLVTGLHVPANLQLLTPSANRSKGNKFDMEAFNAN